MLSIPPVLTRLALVPALLLSLGALAHAVEADPAAAPPEMQQVGDQQVPVWARKEVSMNVTSDDEEDVAFRELWYSSFDGKDWSPWAKHGITYPKNTPLTWTPNEGHWRIYIRKVHVSNAANPVPTAGTPGMKEFIIDRTPPVVTIGFPLSKAKLRGGQKYVVKWDATDPYLKAAPITIEWSRDGKGTFETVAENLPNSGAFEWTVPKDMTVTGQLRISATDKANNVGILVSDNILVDSVNPHGRVLGPAISAKNEILLDLDVADVGPAGLQSARLWVSQDDGTSWNEGPFIQEPFKQVAWKAPADGRFRLYVVATDQAGNQNAMPKGKADDQFVLTVDTVAPAITLGAAIGVVEAEKVNSPKKSFTPGTRLAVPFTIKDANLAPNSVAVYLQTDPSRGWAELGKGLPVDAAFRFPLPEQKASTKTARIKVTALDLAGNLGEVVSSEPFEIDTGVIDDTIQIK
jgi:hypothetical protein